MRQQEQVRLVKELCARLDAGTNVDAGGIRKNPTSAYTDAERADREWHEFFRSRPQLIGLSGDLPESGSFFTIDDLGVPILATRDQDGVFRALVNACRHRGARVVDDERGSTRRFVCPFHNWTYDVAGTLVGLPKDDHFGSIDHECHGLVPLPAAEWHGLLFVHPDPDGSIDIDAHLGPELVDELTSWEFGELGFLDHDSYDVACNWKLAMDTFGETYHFTALHQNTLAFAFHGNVQCYDTFGLHHRMILCRRQIDEMRLRPEDQWRITEAALPVYWLFPNVQLMPFDAGCYLVRAYPVPGEPGRHISRISFYLRPGATDRVDMPGREEQRTLATVFAEIIRDEDYAMSASQQATAESGVLDHVVFGRNEPALHHYHNTYRSVLGLDLLPLLDDTAAPIT